MSNQELLNLLLGEWSGTGRGEFPTIESFEYLETLVFSADGRPFLHYEQKTKRRNPGQTDYIPSHWESGFFRSLPDGQVELVNTQSSGRLERLSGSLEPRGTGLILRLQSTAFLNDPRMVEASRTITLDGDTLHYRQEMHTTAVPGPAYHVEVILKHIPKAGALNEYDVAKVTVTPVTIYRCQTVSSPRRSGESGGVCLHNCR